MKEIIISINKLCLHHHQNQVKTGTDHPLFSKSSEDARETKAIRREGIAKHEELRGGQKLVKIYQNKECCCLDTRLKSLVTMITHTS